LAPLLLGLLLSGTDANAQVADSTARARPIAVSEILDLFKGVGARGAITYVRRNCLASALSQADVDRLIAATADSSFVEAIKNSDLCVAATVVAAEVIDSTGGMVTPSVLALQETCKQGSYAACDSVADKYLEGIFAPKSPTRAAEFLLIACAAEHDPACWRAINIPDESANPSDHTQGARS
jgi:TPR repeat protein